MGSAASVRILILGPSGGPFQRAAALAHEQGARVALSSEADHAVAHLCVDGADLIMADVALDVPALLAKLRAQRIGVPVLACGIDARAEQAVAAIRAGAYDYAPLPPDRELIAAIILTAGSRSTTLIGSDPALLRAVDFAKAFAAASVPMLITGEAGSGKELLARIVHEASGRSGPFLTTECAGVPGDVLEAELFGHEAGAFAGASARAGRLREADRGTLLLRNIHDLPASLQARLMRLFTNEVALDTRLIATLDPAATSQLRADLHARFALVTVELPPLRARQGDIADLARHFAAQLSHQHGFAAKALRADTSFLLTSYTWPGNVREMQDVVHRAVLLASGAAIEPQDIVLCNGTRIAPPEVAPDLKVEGLVGQTMADVERELILQTLERCGGNRTSASHILGISIRTMRNKLKTFMDAGHAVSPAL